MNDNMARTDRAGMKKQKFIFVYKCSEMTMGSASFFKTLLELCVYGTREKQ